MGSRRLLISYSVLLAALANPIGSTYDAATREMWVSNYSGTIQFTDSAAEP